MKLGKIKSTVLLMSIALLLSGCVTATSRLQKAKEGLSGEFSWQLLDMNGEEILYENPKMQIINSTTKMFPTLPVVSIGSSDSFGYISVLNLDDDDREDVCLSATFIGDMDDAFSFFEKGKGYIGVRVSAVISIDKKNHIFASCENHLSRVTAYPYSRIEMTQEFRHAYHSYVGGILFHEDLKVKLMPNHKDDQPIYAVIKKGSWFKLGS